MIVAWGITGGAVYMMLASETISPSTPCTAPYEVNEAIIGGSLTIPSVGEMLAQAVRQSSNHNCWIGSTSR
jgi:hypothetical protein